MKEQTTSFSWFDFKKMEAKKRSSEEKEWMRKKGGINKTHQH
jgi:hypothetical protein